MPASKPGLFKDVPHSDITYRITGAAPALSKVEGPPTRRLPSSSTLAARASNGSAFYHPSISKPVATGAINPPSNK